MSFSLKGVFSKLIAVRKSSSEAYFDVLDGWRGLSILFVLATHLLPLGPKDWKFNLTFGHLGMSLFFTLSGFLITNFLLHRPNVYCFLVRRFLRIIPLAYLYIFIAFSILHIDPKLYFPHLLFFSNWPPMFLAPGTSHFWSLCVEMQFYVGIALLFLAFKERAFYLSIVLCVFVTIFRVYNGVHVAINTYYRIDEVLVGVILAMVYNKKLGDKILMVLGSVNAYLIFLALFISCHPNSGFMNYLRPYFAAMLVATSLFSTKDTYLKSFLKTRVLVYIASISYALYVIHPLLTHTWLGSGEVFEKYSKRPLLFIVLFLLAHLSTFYYEKRWISLAKRVTSRYR